MELDNQAESTTEIVKVILARLLTFNSVIGSFFVPLCEIINPSHKGAKDTKGIFLTGESLSLRFRAWKNAH